MLAKVRARDIPENCHAIRSNKASVERSSCEAARPERVILPLLWRTILLITLRLVKVGGKIIVIASEVLLH